MMRKDPLNTNDTLKQSSNLSFYFIAISIIGFCILLMPFILNLDNIEKYGYVGDTVGGLLNPVIGIGVGFLTFMAFLVQFQANQQVREQFEEQISTNYRQNFENTFFNLLTIHHQIIENIDFDFEALMDSDDELRQYLGSLHEHSALRNKIYSGIDVKSRDVFKLSFELLKGLANDDLEYLEFNTITYSDPTKQASHLYQLKQKKDLFDNMAKFKVEELNFNGLSIQTSILSIYNFIYLKLNTDYGHYFRNLYRIVKVVDEAKFDLDEKKNFEIKYFYTSIIRSQLSDFEISWLFFNCLSERGSEKFKPLIEKYSMLKIIDLEDPLFEFYNGLYKSSAYRRE